MSIKFTPTREGEVSLDAATQADVRDMFLSIPSIRIARDSYLAMVLCGPFSFSIPKLGLVSKSDMQTIIAHYWMPWQRKVYDWVKQLGICPYYFKRLKNNKDHQVPVVPDMELGFITVSVNKDHEVEYSWYWNHGRVSERDSRMYWVTSDHRPDKNGRLHSALATLVERYRTLRIMQSAQETATTQAARPTHLFEYIPKVNNQNDNLGHLVADFGEKAAGMSKLRRDMQTNRDIQVNTKQFQSQMARTHLANRNIAKANVNLTATWTDMPRDALDRMDNGLATRSVPMRPDFKYVSVKEPHMIGDLWKAQETFDTIAAALMDFAVEFIRPTGSARSQNIKGSERFENERIKEGLNFFKSITQAALVIAYKDQFEDAFEGIRQWRVSRKGGDPYSIAELYPELDVQVDMSCTPMTSYEELKEMWTDGILNKDDFAMHAFHMKALPKEQVSIAKEPDRVPDSVLGVKDKGVKSTPPKKKKMKMATD